MLHILYTFMRYAERIIPAKPDIEILGNLCIRDGFIMATDLQTFIRMPVSIKESFLIPVQLLKKLLLAKPSRLKIDIIREDKVELCYDNQKLFIPFQDTLEYPAYPTARHQPMGFWTPSVFNQLAAQSVFVSTDSFRPALNGILVTQGKQLTSVATNGHILQLISNLDPNDDCDLKNPFTALIPAMSLKHISKAVHSRVYLFKSDTYLHLELASNVEISIRLIDEEYVNYQSVLPSEFNSSLILDKNDLLKEIKQLKSMAGLLGNRLHLTIEKDCLAFSLSDIDSSINYESTMEVEYQGAPFHTCFDLPLFEKTIRAVNEESLTWYFNTADQASIFTGNMFTKNLLMPIRLESINEKYNHKP